jgi:hypothetical protein
MRFLLFIFLLTLTTVVYCQNNKYLEKDSITELYIAEEMPVFPGGQDSLQMWIFNKTKKAQTDTNCIITKINISFSVDTTGYVINPEVMFRNPFLYECLKLEAFCKTLESELVSMPAWTPGRQGGKKVRVRFYMPVNIDWQ